MSGEEHPGLEPSETWHPKWVYASNSSFQFTVTFLGTAQTLYLLFYYETVIGLNASFVFLALTIFTVYDACNDPIIGFLTDRNTRWTRKWGRRFPWIVIGFAPWCMALYLVFSVPVGIDATVNPWPVFGWLVLSLVVLDTAGTLVNINVAALRPDKFRSEDERRILSGYFAVFDMVAQAVGMIVPPLFLEGGTGREAYAFMGGMCAMIGLISAVFFLPGCREEKVVIDRYFVEKKEKDLGFFAGFKEVLKLKSFVVFFVALTTFNIASSLLMTNVPYLTTFVIRESTDTITLIFAVFLIGALLSIPFWLQLLKRTKNSKMVLSVGGFAAGFALIPMNFFIGLIDLMIILFILGFSLGSMWAYFYTVTQAEVCDDFVARTGKNQKALLIGVVTFIGRLVATADEGIIAIIHNATGFIPGYDSFDTMAALGANMNLVTIGIRLISGIIPAAILLAGVLFFWKKYPLTPDVICANQARLRELGL